MPAPATEARAEFAARFAKLYRAAGSPPLAAVANAAGSKVTDKRVSDWKNGTHVPETFVPLRRALEYLISRSGLRPERTDLASLRAWRELWETARTKRVSDPPPSQERSPRPLALPQRRVPSDRLRGRDRLVTTMTEGGPGVWVLCGLGGCGKTTVALEVAHRLAARARVWWARASDGEDLVGALHAVGYDAGARRRDFDLAHPADVLWRVLDALAEPWLLVLDNVDDPAVLVADDRPVADGVGWLRAPRHGTVVVTTRETRAETWGSWVRRVPVDALGVEDAAAILHDLAPLAGDADDARALAADLGGLALALDLAGSHLAAAATDIFPDPCTPETFDAYRQVLDERLGEIGGTWELSLDLLHRQGHDLARPMLRLLSCFASAPLPYRALLDSDTLAASGLFHDPTHVRIRHTLQGLAGLRLITVEGGMLDIHPLVRASNRAQADAACHDLMVALLNRAVDGLDMDGHADWPRWQALAPHCRAPLRARPGGVDDTSDAVAMTEPLRRAAYYRQNLGLYAEATADLRTVTALRVERLGADHAATLESRLFLAWTLRENGQWEEAEAEYRALCVHPHLVTARTGLARVLRDQGRYAEAESELRAALQAPQPNLREMLRARRDLAILCDKQGRTAEAIAPLRELWQECQDAFGDSDLDSLACGTSLTNALLSLGETAAARRVCSEVLDTCGRVLEPEHPQLLAARHELARVVRDEGCLAEAEAEFRTIWKINEERLGGEHHETVVARHELATVLHLAGALTEAQTHFRAVLDINRRRLGDDHPSTRTCQMNLEHLTGNHPGGPDLSGLTLEAALDLEETTLRPTHRQMLRRADRPQAHWGNDQDDAGGGYSSFAGEDETHYQGGFVEQRAEPVHRLAPSMFRQVALGRVTRETVQSVWAEQRSTRIQFLRMILDKLGDDQTLRNRLRRAANVDDLLCHPMVGRWMAHTLRQEQELDAGYLDTWSPKGHRVETGTGTVWLDDADPYRIPDTVTPPDPLSSDQVERWRSLITKAWKLHFDLDPSHAIALDTAIVTITPLPGKPGTEAISVSSSDAFGGMALTKPTDHVEMAATLTHEFQHMMLDSVLNLVELYDEHDDGSRFSVPWRPDPRPLDAAFHGLHAFLGVTDFWYELSRQANSPHRDRAEAKFTRWRHETGAILREIRSAPRFTLDGQQFLQIMAQRKWL